MMERALTANYVTDWAVLEEDSVQYDKETIPYVYKAKEVILEIIHFLILIVKVK